MKNNKNKSNVRDVIKAKLQVDSMLVHKFNVEPPGFVYLDYFGFVTHIRPDVVFIKSFKYFKRQGKRKRKRKKNLTRFSCVAIARNICKLKEIVSRAKSNKKNQSI